MSKNKVITNPLEKDFINLLTDFGFKRVFGSKPYLSGEYDEFFNASSTGNLTEEEAVLYSQSYFKELDNQSAVRFAANRSKAEGRAEGQAEKTLEIARSMISIGMADDIIMEVTRLTAKDLSELHKTIE